MKLYACVTGAERGLGYEMAKVLLEDGYTVFAGRYNKDWKLLDELNAKYPDSLYVVDLDVSSDASVKEAAGFIRSKTDRIDVLVNNSAISGNYDPTIFDELDFDEMLRVFNVNCLGATRVTNELIRLIMNSDKKLIMNISSEAGSISTTLTICSKPPCCWSMNRKAKNGRQHGLTNMASAEWYTFRPGTSLRPSWSPCTGN